MPASAPPSTPASNLFSSCLVPLSSFLHLLVISRAETSCEWMPVWLLAWCGGITVGFPCWLRCTESAHEVGDPGSTPGSRRSPGEKNGNPLKYSCLENSMDRGAWQASHQGAPQTLHPSSDLGSGAFWALVLTGKSNAQTVSRVR